MARTRRRWLAAIAATVSIAGCVGDGDDSDGGGDGSTDGGTDGGDTDGGTDSDGGGSSDGGMGGTATTIATTQHDQFGEILVDGGGGMTLYMFDPDPQGEGSSSCTGGCADNWPPLTTDGEVATGDGVGASTSTFERGDGSTQVAGNGWPLYYWQGDSEPGDVTGQGVNDVWWVLDPSGAPIRESEGSSNNGSGDSNDGGSTTGY